MRLSYDFDMFSVVPAEGSVPAETRRMYAEIGFEGRREATSVALFRDPATAAALMRAPKPLREYLRAVGFGFGTYHSGAPPCRYPAGDETARTAVIEALAAELPRHPITGQTTVNEGDFDIAEFFEAVMSAEPLPPDAPLMAPIFPIPPEAVPATSPGLLARLGISTRWLFVALPGLALLTGRSGA